jgi:hypothetical protein
MYKMKEEKKGKNLVVKYRSSKKRSQKWFMASFLSSSVPYSVCPLSFTSSRKGRKKDV